ncbi:heat shock protein [Indibacter alkaliphilus LW1]|uniref:Heat shock protein n=1 Tax=Indibacter alkaliphilus (strain CCUG 57479 / KCTC 22604 / LW1) TaxID=1189612 RepID=S2DRE3_INDAL|nr:DnaJ domain-containing protein [Indibacter alkaliphilus]EOZ99855.1 heat shock protein [Indibacter alkaliphilus LW1]
MNYYESLELNKDANEEEIKASFHKLYKDYRNNSTLSEEEKRDFFSQLIEAYETLSNPEKRKLYDLEDYNSIITDYNEDKYPSIKLFEIDTESRKEKLEIIVSWETSNADHVEISPFGEMIPNGRGVFSLEEFKIPNDEIVITAINKTQNLVIKKKKELDYNSYNRNSGFEKTEGKKLELNENNYDLFCQSCGNNLKRHHLYCGKCGNENPNTNLEKIKSDLANSKQIRKKVNKVFWILFFTHGILEMILGGSFKPSAFLPPSINVLFSYLIVGIVLKYRSGININRLVILVYLIVLITRILIIGFYPDL